MYDEEFQQAVIQELAATELKLVVVKSPIAFNRAGFQNKSAESQPVFQSTACAYIEFLNTNETELVPPQPGDHRCDLEDDQRGDTSRLLTTPFLTIKIWIWMQNQLRKYLRKRNPPQFSRLNRLLLVIEREKQKTSTERKLKLQRIVKLVLFQPNRIQSASRKTTWRKTT